MQDLLINGDKGWLNARLKHMRDVQRKLEKNNAENDSIINESQLNESVLEVTAQADIVFMKSMVISDDKMDILLQKLNSTRKFRQAMVLDKSIHLKEQFPYFFTNPELVNMNALFPSLQSVFTKHFFQILKEFELSNEKVNCRAFFEKWPNFSTKLWDILTKHYNQHEFGTDWAKDIEEVLVLLKIFPSRQVGKNVIASDRTFENSVKNFIQFEPVGHLCDLIW